MGLYSIRACVFLVALIVIATAFVYFFNRSILFIKWGALWIVITMAAFLSGNIWFLTAVVALVCFLGLGHSPSEKIVYYFLLLPAVPSYIFYEIPGFLGVRFWFDLTYPRMLELFILMPLFFYNFYHHDRSKKLFQISIDKYVVLYLTLLFILNFREATLTGALRSNFYLILDIFIPYFVISRSVSRLDDFKKIFSAILFSGIVLSIIGIFEELRGWLLYAGLDKILHTLSSGYAYYLGRGQFLRVEASMGHPITFGFFLVTALGTCLYLKSVFKNQNFFYKTTIYLLVIALFFTISRGPWVGCAVFFITLVMFQGKRMGKILLPFLLISLSFPFLMDTSIGKGFYNFLPIAKTENYATVDYRKSLITESSKVIMKTPFFGSVNYLETGELESLRTGERIIDLVNTYIVVALSYGLIGLSLFISIFISLLLRLYLISINKINNRNKDMLYLGQVLFSVILSMIVIVGTAALGGFSQFYYWSFIALGASYLSMVKKGILNTYSNHSKGSGPNVISKWMQYDTR